MNYKKVSFRPTPEGQQFLSELAARYECSSTTQLMNNILADLQRFDIAGVGEPAPPKYRPPAPALVGAREEPKKMGKDDAVSVLLPAFLEQQQVVNQLDDAMGVLIARLTYLEAENHRLQNENTRLGQLAVTPFLHSKPAEKESDMTFEYMLGCLEKLSRVRRGG
ncbi:MAG TPA: hypothetical protein VJL54_02235 [Nitrososphaera sp.]|nr:hypothetical protein [Nitrososphaera sp.]